MAQIRGNSSIPPDMIFEFHSTSEPPDIASNIAFPFSLAEQSTSFRTGSKGLAATPSMSIGSLHGKLDIRPEVLRGARLSSVLRGCGALWRTSPIDLQPSERKGLWNMSMQCESIDAFISQTWRSSGTERYLTLLVRFYWAPAAGAGFVSLILLAVLDLLGKLPTLEQPKMERIGWAVPATCNPSPWPVLPPLVALLALFIAPRIPGLPDRTVFFDAVCINQTDDDLKTEGVYALGGFVIKSSEFIILWSRQYFRRAWCVFELAVFMALRRGSPIRFYPLFVTRTLFIGHATCLVWNVVFSLTDYLNAGVCSSLVIWLLRGLLLLPLPFFVRRLRLYSLAFQDLNKQLAHFSLDSAECRVDSDLNFIKRSVDQLYGDEEKFNEFVRTNLKEIVSASEGNFELHYCHCVIVVAPLITYAISKSISFICAGTSPQDFALNFAAGASFAMFMLPSLVRLLFGLCRLCAQQHSSASVNVACNIGISVVMIVSVIGLLVASIVTSAQIPFGRQLVFGLGALLACATFRPRWMQRLFSAVRTHAQAKPPSVAPACGQEASVHSLAQQSPLETAGDATIEAG